MTFMKVRVCAGCLIAILAVSSALQAQDRNTPDARAFKRFLESLSLRRNARVCERGIPDYGKTFGVLYGSWSERHRDELTRGQAILSEALKTNDVKKYPFTNRAALVRAKEAQSELANAPKDTSPIKMDAPISAACEKVLAALKDQP